MNIGSSRPSNHENYHTLEVTIPQKGAIRARKDSGKSLFLRDIIGEIQAIVFSSRDQQLVIGDPSLRRNFLDDTATLVFPEYYHLLRDSRRVGKQRVALLKQLSQQYDLNPSEYILNELETWTSQFIDLGIRISRWRAELISRLNKTFSHIYQGIAASGQASETLISSSSASARLEYMPSFEEILETDNDSDAHRAISEHFRRLYAGEVSRGANLIGPHRDDMQILLDDEPAKDFASNGEAWTLALALKMSIFSLYAQDELPVLILDDVFAQLDDERRMQILEFARKQGQVIITSATKADIPVIDEATHIVDVAVLAQADSDEERKWE
jgi:DNA replication and repair protein RecF